MNHNLNRLQRVQNSLARVVCIAPYHSSATCLRHSLHWLPIRQRIEYKVASLSFKVWLYQLPTYLSELVIDYVPVKTLRSSNKILLAVPRAKNTIASLDFHHHSTQNLDQSTIRHQVFHLHPDLPAAAQDPLV